MQSLSQDIKDNNKSIDLKKLWNYLIKLFSFRNEDISSSYSLREKEGNKNNINNNIKLSNT